MRLGLALGRSRGEVRALPAPEYRDWQLMYLLEPWGWHNLEYLASAIMAMILNVNVKESDRKKSGYFMREMKNIIIKASLEQDSTAEDEYKAMSRAEKRAFAIKQIKGMFGNVKVKK